MKKVVKISLFFFGFAAMVIGSGSTKAGTVNVKVLVNHTSANGTKTVELAIDENALAGHLSHGDSVVDGGDNTGL